MAAFAEALAHVFLPSRCLSCGAGLRWRSSRAGVCSHCWSSLRPHAEPLCQRCGAPTSVGVCLDCRETPPPWDAAISFGPYEDTVRELLLLLKFGRRDELAEPLGEVLADVHDSSGWDRPDAIVSVPLPWTRRLHRGFNQAALLARPVARRLSVPQQPLLRRARSAPQVGRSRRQRLAAVATAFSARSNAPETVLLIDDVVTTGATARACSRALRAAGAKRVHVLTLARTPAPRRTP